MLTRLYPGTLTCFWMADAPPPAGEPWPAVDPATGRTQPRHSAAAAAGSGGRFAAASRVTDPCDREPPFYGGPGSRGHREPGRPPYRGGGGGRPELDMDPEAAAAAGGLSAVLAARRGPGAWDEFGPPPGHCPGVDGDGGGDGGGLKRTFATSSDDGTA